MNKQQAIEMVNNNLSSIFTKQDVIDLLNKIEGDTSVESVIEKVVGVFDRLGSDIVDLDSAELELYGNEVHVNSVDVDVDKVVKHIRQALLS